MMMLNESEVDAAVHIILVHDTFSDNYFLTSYWCHPLDEHNNNSSSSK